MCVCVGMFKICYVYWGDIGDRLFLDIDSVHLVINTACDY